ncbi:MAG: IS3 family transposase [Proteobacteria bacterium]|nr:IS3 family transposase [Pseudomonadota bacterium]
MAEMICAIQDEVPGYGYRRVTEELARRGQVVNHKRVARVMKAQGLGITPRRRFVRTTDSCHDQPVFPNLYRNIIPSRPNQVWVGDLTTSRLSVGFCYLAVILDACSRKVGLCSCRGAWIPSSRWQALAAAVRSRKPAAGCIHHTDRGSQNASELDRQALADFGLRGSMRAGQPVRQCPS